jgi:hypothetical protein
MKLKEKSKFRMNLIEIETIISSRTKLKIKKKIK